MKANKLMKILQINNGKFVYTVDFAGVIITFNIVKNQLIKDLKELNDQDIPIKIVEVSENVYHIRTDVPSDISEIKQ
jgi:hypothetical protein